MLAGWVTLFIAGACAFSPTPATPLAVSSGHKSAPSVNVHMRGWQDPFSKPGAGLEKKTELKTRATSFDEEMKATNAAMTGPITIVSVATIGIIFLFLFFQLSQPYQVS